LLKLWLRRFLLWLRCEEILPIGWESNFRVRGDPIELEFWYGIFFTCEEFIDLCCHMNSTSPVLLLKVVPT